MSQTNQQMKPVTHLDNFVPASGYNDRVHRVRGESDAGDPSGVALVLDFVLALPQGVPEFDCSVAGTGHDLRQRTSANDRGQRRDMRLTCRLSALKETDRTSLV